MEATPMKLVGIISTAVLSLALGATAPAFAQQEQHDQQEGDKARPAQDEKKAQPEKPAKQEEKSAQQQDKNNQQEEKNAQQQNKNNQQEEKNASQQDKNAKQQENARQNEKNAPQQEHSQQAKPVQQEQHASNGRGRIPEDRFRANFGNEHRFRVSQADYTSRRFQYGGYSFGFVDAWPSNWLYTQEVFVVEIDGVYYLCNASYPGVNLALSITL
jgi:outer membrane biosynthesis protein TonB